MTRRHDKGPAERFGVVVTRAIRETSAMEADGRAVIRNQRLLCVLVLAVVVGDRIFVMADPDWLVCVNAVSGKELWRRSVCPPIETLPAAQCAAARDALRRPAQAAGAEQREVQGGPRTGDYCLRRDRRRSCGHPARRPVEGAPPERWVSHLMRQSYMEQA